MQRFTLLLIACSACWGAGPTPTSPSGSEIIFKVPPTYRSDVCTNERYPYIGDVAFGGEYAYVTEMHFSPPTNDCGNIGGGMTTDLVPVHRITLATGDGPTFMVGSSQGSITTRVVGTPARGGWVHSPNDGMRMEFRGLGGPPERDLPYSGGLYLPVGLVGDDTNAYVVGTTGASNVIPDVNSPRYPCCYTGGSNTMQASVGWKLAWEDDGSVSPIQMSLPTEKYVIGDTLKSGVVANSSTLFYAMRDRAQLSLDTDLQSMPKDNTTDFTSRAQVPNDIGIPVGLAASDSVLAWTVSASYARLPIPEPRCGLYLLDLVTPGADPVRHFTSLDFSCQDLAIDETHAYFMIVKVEQDDNSDNNPADMRGIGIGRVSLSSPAVFESVATGGDSLFSGPRRIYIHGEDLYLVDPFAIARVSKSALDGQADF